MRAREAVLREYLPNPHAVCWDDLDAAVDAMSADIGRYRDRLLAAEKRTVHAEAAVLSLTADREHMARQLDVVRALCVDDECLLAIRILDALSTEPHTP